MSGRREKAIRRAARKARQAITDDTWQRTLGLPIGERIEIAWSLITRGRNVVADLVGLLILLFILATTLTLLT